ncbi:unnamed protein product [Penicillium salamii]|nr:unnamed protein product [Penicillium salamii]
MLSPDNRFQFFLSNDWSDAKELRDQYRVAFQDALTPIQERLAINKSPQGILIAIDITNSEPLSFWKENKSRFPAIASLTQDYLAIPTTNTDVERLFNTARDIYHYRRDSLKSGTIEELMLYLYTSKFDLNIQEAKELKQFFASNEIDALMEEKDETPDDVEIDEISDTKEQGDLFRDLVEIDNYNLDGDDDDAAVPQLPSTYTQQRTLGRKRIRVEDNIYEHY